MADGHAALPATRPAPTGAEDAGPALFRAYPSLRPRLPRIPFVTAPTPVAPLRLPELAGARAYVKDDSLSCPLYGGNKPRKLEFVIARARARGARRLVTTGGLGTHHGLATAILGAEARLATTLVLVRQPLLPAVRRSLLLHAAYGAELVYAGNVPGAALQTARVLLRSTLSGERPFLVATGGSSPLGNLGFVSAALELGEQVEAGLLPEPDEIYVAVGTGGTLAGLAVGLRLAGLGSLVRGVVVTDILPPSPRRLARAARATLALLRRLEPAVPAVDVGETDFALETGQVGPGYGAPTQAALEAVDAAARAGLRLETTYTGKCLAALRARATAGELPATVLFWNTFNAVDVEARAPRPPAPELLPPSLRRFAETT